MHVSNGRESVYLHDQAHPQKEGGGQGGQVGTQKATHIYSSSSFPTHSPTHQVLEVEMLRMLQYDLVVPPRQLFEYGTKTLGYKRLPLFRQESP